MILLRDTIKFRMLVMVGACLGLIVLLLVVISIYRTNKNTNLVSAEAQTLLKDSANKMLLAESALQRSSVQKHFQAGYHGGLDLADNAVQFRRMILGGDLEALTARRELTKLVADRLVRHSELLSLYVVFEPNSLDGHDNDFIGRKELGSNETGRFSIYAAQQDGRLVLQPTPEALIADTTIMLDGTPFNKWYTCPKLTGKPCLLSPYFDESSGRKTLITTLSFPLIEDGKVLGVVGMDVSLESVQQLVQESSKKLFGGEGQVSIFSPTGLLAGHSGDAKKLGLQLVQAGVGDALNLESSVKSGLTFLGVINNTQRVAVPVQPIPGSSYWGVVLDIPSNVVMQPANALKIKLDERNFVDTAWSAVYGLVALFFGLIIILVIARKITVPIHRISEMLREVAGSGGDLTKRLQYSRNDELGMLVMWFNAFLDKLQPMMSELKRLVLDAHTNADRSAIISSKISTEMQQQYREIDQAATASNEMSSSAQEVACGAARAADATGVASIATQDGLRVIRLTSETIEGLAEDLSIAMSKIEGLTGSSERIGNVLGVIQAVAEQTNLLALNAAIEAARAGEAGRGFAVVADEVRNLASNTSDSIEEIRDVIQQLQRNTLETVSAMKKGSAQAGVAVKHVNQASDAFDRIKESVGIISEMNFQIAAAVEEQSRVAEEVSQNVVTIRDVTESLSAQAQESQKVSRSINSLAIKQQALANQFLT
ncbi:hypothetical protein PspS34_14435 [Pseudomonas sp. S34]|uniref:methyl-accepting chemotaxis protein n=1 Tax=Pseudomonas sp. S34 TaxID=1573718 RepID=UPI00132F0CC5|nr:methyl-accepting chemotaxis protein [Pseudomonas sp. S34]QHF39386.1 hypothetical protein PspS34_14435 [Pseudomonas sp. S34]